MDRYRITHQVVQGARPGQSLAVKQFFPQGPSPTGRPVTLLLAHATGFHKELWEPLLEELPLSSADEVLNPPQPSTHISNIYWGSSKTATDHPRSWHIARIIAFDGWCHGDSAALNRSHLQQKTSWLDNTRDILALIQQLSIDTALIGVGHSYGASSLLLTEIVKPGTFAALLPVEPVIAFAGPRFLETSFERVLSRKAQWRDIAEAHTYFTRHPFFRDWDPRVQALHVQHGLTSVPGTEAWQLKCHPKDEYEVFQGGFRDAVWLLSRLVEIGCPLRYLMGEESTICPNEQFGQAHANASIRADVYIIKGSGHLLLMERPALVASHLALFLTHAMAFVPNGSPLKPQL
ncbi:hypothetical protein H4R33_001085 [Dimargaris cristalligena]|uniref:Alpha/beta hydrolase fold-1 n=1 Tax=Dimargaris cristalligena TaxID=215637 RepID=A0A4V1J5A0_9FUNG|nr:hypothetical protein H4R33_001085 [Dimargaris cristalligena]RKP38329.1 Alpha/beta hydrolase fold-1 [Dimargaris cristalligena]|eukprot:RKP38329.1 Alpha/beta hydrolase fold-1 [Dimargaris cristalligena]